MDIKILEVDRESFQVYLDENPVGAPQSELEAIKLARFLRQQVEKARPALETEELLE